ncbi:DUF2220 domain-containing protein [Bifidobacterium biavatii]|uniref:Wadjet protein JetD C-terminal domain-containing protein n=1 Tax=Bifidobacterium biavatii DSM 23969 TaxID=1437608 RepID=A0A086ZZ74_9BIFI|nr:DUF2220 domain-containing protein [Bifidobacterium biavatii]KFI51824.1 hypothetical protein BBIA_0742 [Bifidobacterium biavatii DSM 23969]
MRTVRDIAAMIGRRLSASRYADGDAWPYTVSVQLPSRQSDLEDAALAVHTDGNVHANNKAIRDWAARTGCETTVQRRLIGNVTVELISNVIVGDETVALRVVDRATAADYRRARRRLERIHERFGHIPATDALTAARMTDAEDDVDFELLLHVAAYCASHDIAGLRPRAVPLAGFSAKWLDRKATKRRKAVELLCGKSSLALDERPRELRFRHLDPTRVLLPDAVAVRPWDDGVALGIRCVVIVENKDTYQLMPPIRDGLCVFGSGKAAADGLTLLSWLFDERAANVHIVYWGDMDSAGFEILSAVRQLGIDCDSLFMDRTAYDRYGMFGTNDGPDGKPLARQQPKPLSGLRDDERELYEALCTGEDVAYLRLEQERIPIPDAAAALHDMGIPVVTD